MTPRLIFSILLSLPLAKGAVLTTALRTETAKAWDRYIKTFEEGPWKNSPAGVAGGQLMLTDLNPTGENHGGDVPGGYIHHWMGAMKIPNLPELAVEKTLEDYTHFPDTYSPELKSAVATRLAAPADERKYDLFLVTEQKDPMVFFPFAFNIHQTVTFRVRNQDHLVESRSYRIRESNSGHAPYADLLPEGEDHGILWRLNSYWKLRQDQNATYAELQVISLSRKPFFGTSAHVKDRARKALESTFRDTEKRAGTLAGQ